MQNVTGSVLKILFPNSTRSERRRYARAMTFGLLAGVFIVGLIILLMWFMYRRALV